MIPKLSTSHKLNPQLDQVTLRYLASLKQAGFTGDIGHDYATRLSMATDNSIYQLLPQAVLFPRNRHDVQLIAHVANQIDFTALTFTPRGGGTGTNGQSLTDGIVVDLSRYMNHILDLNLSEGWVKVEAGVIKDQLNQYLKPYGYFFCPELSTSNRATIGGMINTDASGQGSMVYGKTSDHVLALNLVLMNGELLETGKKTVAEAEALAKSSPIYRTVFDYCKDHRDLILQKFPRLNRFLTGYDLKHVFNDRGDEFDLTRIITGSEGSLAWVTEAKLHIIPLPKYRFLVTIKYDSFHSALSNAPFLVKAEALSVETVDSKVLGLAKDDIIWQSISDLITDVADHEMQGINIVEFSGNDYALVKGKVDALCQQLNQLMLDHSFGIIGYQTCDQLSQIEKIYAMRKKAVGLLGNVKGVQKPIPFVEDTCVPPEHLTEYITEFRALLDSYHLTYGMFGHVDSGVLHVRPALDMCDPEQEKWVKQISDQVVALTAKYGGLLWGEHGKGFRSQYSPQFFGPELYRGLRIIKTAFDPNNRLNPGKICTPLGKDDDLRSITATTRGFYDRQIPLNVKQHFRGVTECNGNGLCFNFDVNSPMCPSMKLSSNRVYSPKGRAALMREWLRLMIDAGVDEAELDALFPKSQGSLAGLAKKILYTWRAKQGEYDFSHEVKDSMAHCLSCKACATQCPIKIDVPEFKARFLQLYHTRYLRPVRDYLVGYIESYLPIMAKAPRFFNFFMKMPATEYLTRKTVGMANLPLLSTPTLKQQLVGHSSANIKLAQLRQLSANEKRQYLLIVQDPFTSYYDAKVVYDFVCLVEKLGFKPVLLPFIPNGKPQHIKGFLKQFSQTAQTASAALSEIAELGIPMVGVDPALVLCYRDEYKRIFHEKIANFRVLLTHEWLITLLDQLSRHAKENQTESASNWYLLGHCSETTQLPASNQQWQQIFARVGAKLTVVNVGCCGMAGTYGHEVNNLDASKQLYQLSWQKALAMHPIDHCLTTGYSCRSQVKHFDKQILKHPVQALLELISAN
ncbi:FAD-binding and (Fe-S)-binding domain-containing protein [Orbaceae bacterium ESL0727]|nr:FAD-binding and (Fe-S)-binding domain-containing protein [Orbaceae bacterium ESL0727]